MCKVDLFCWCGASAARTRTHGACRPETAFHLMNGTCLAILSLNKQCQCAIVRLLGCVATALVSFQNRLHEPHWRGQLLPYARSSHTRADESTQCRRTHARSRNSKPRPRETECSINILLVLCCCLLVLTQIHWYHYYYNYDVTTASGDGSFYYSNNRRKVNREEEEERERKENRADGRPTTLSNIENRKIHAPYSWASTIERRRLHNSTESLCLRLRVQNARK